jgi:hypothetical protein
MTRDQFLRETNLPDILEQSWFKKLPEKVKKDPIVSSGYKTWSQHMLNIKGWREPTTRKHVPKSYSKQDYSAARQAKSAALFRAKQLMTSEEN